MRVQAGVAVAFAPLHPWRRCALLWTPAPPPVPDTRQCFAHKLPDPVMKHARTRLFASPAWLLVIGICLSPVSTRQNASLSFLPILSSQTHF